MNSFSRGGFDKKSWINDLVSSPRFAKDLTSLYADDVLEAVESKEFGTLEAALDDLKIRIGLSSEESEMIHKVASFKANPKLFNAIENIKTISAEKLGKLIVAYTTECMSCKVAPCTCGDIMDPIVRQAMDEIGIEKVAEIHDASVKTAGELPAGLKKWQEENGKGKKSDKPAEETDKTEESEKEAEASACAVVKTATRAEEKAEHEKVEKDLEEVKEEVKDHEAKEAKEAKGASDMSTKKANIQKWMQHFKKQSYFQNQVEAPSAEAGGKNVSNDPEKLGYPKEVEYSHTELNPPVGDVRKWEDNAFDAAAKETAKVLGPKGEEKKLKEDLQRAKWDSFFKKQSGAKK